jgi:hypothetical protein
LRSLSGRLLRPSTRLELSLALPSSPRPFLRSLAGSLRLSARLPLLQGLRTSRGWLLTLLSSFGWLLTLLSSFGCLRTLLPRLLHAPGGRIISWFSGRLGLCLFSGSTPLAARLPIATVLLRGGRADAEQ